ncbi:PA14 domain-containing protein [Streptomyces sp. TRM76323]|uniref:PA14 domain-containing protein n=1 Tax=Streptomyces tamarix TaxID=3078565 RepID=A0ABU3QS53_9ACTN|nr:PA14 domain-containing protein [Streptomyces tamarix]MDT9685324.1 PA14 domain-containing protein [Streptomyces tamarix]
MNRPRGTTAATAGAVVLATAGGLLAAAPSASAAVTCASPVFKRTFYANTTFSGTPKATDCDSAIDENWGTGAPRFKGMPANNFGVRWAVTRDFGSGGPFTFTASSRDGIRVYLDGVRKVDLWKDVGTTVSRTVNLTIPSGRHSLRVDFVNWTGSANVKFSYAPRTSATVDKVKPLSPTGFTASYSTATTSTKVSWAKNKEMDLAGYRVYRRVQGASFPAKPLATTTSTSYTDTTVPKDGNVYHYEVRAHDKAGNASPGTVDLAVTTVDRTAPAAPKGIEDNWSMDYPDEITLYWDGNTEADLAGYRVYRSTSSPVTLTAENRMTGDTLSPGGYTGPLPQTGDVYYYVVTAVDRHGNESPPSGTAMYYTRDLIGPVDTALNARASESEAGVTLTWDASERTSDDFAGYSVFRSLKPRGSRATTVEVGKGLKGTSFTDAAPPPGATYYYWVIALDHERNGGTPSQELAVTVAGNTTAPAAVTGLTATPKENGVTLSWDPSGDAGLDHYLVLRGTLVDGKWSYVPMTHPADFKPWEIEEVTFHDGVPADGQQVRYGVVAVDQYGNRLTPDTGASTAEVTELDLRPTAPPTTGSPLGHLGVDRSGWLHWWLSSDTNENGSKVSAFNIRRWNPQTRTFELIGTEPRGDSASGWNWSDRSLPAATTVYYRVSALYEDGTESGAAEAVTATY